MEIAANYFSRISKKINFQKVFLSGVVAITLYLVLVPLVFLIWNSFHTAATPLEQAPLGLKNFSKAYLDPATYHMMFNTLWFALGSVAVGLTLGVGFAWLLERTNVPFKALLYALVPLPMIIPGMLSAVAWILLLSPRIGLVNLVLKGLFGFEKAPFDIYTIGGMFFVEGIRLVPTMFLMMVGAFRSMDPSLEEASSAAGCGTLTTLRRITAPMMLPAILSAGMYSFTTVIQAFSVPGIIGLTAGIHVFSTQIFLTARTVPANYSLASAFAVTFIVVSSLLMIAYTRMTKRAERFTTITGKGYRPRVIDLGPWRHVMVFFIITFVLIALVLPAFILLWGSLQPFYQPPSIDLLSLVSLESYRSAFGYPQIMLAFKNTVLVMVGSATFTAVLAALISWIVVRTTMTGRNFLDMLTFLPHGIPSIVIGLSLVLVYLRLSFIPIYDTLWIIMLAFCTRYMTFGVRTMNAAMHQLHKELEEAASVSGAMWWQMFTRITMPLLVPSLIGVWIWTAMHAAREVSAAIMLSSPKTTVVSVIIWDLWREGMVTETCVIGMVLMAFIAIVMILGRIYGFKVGRRGGS